MFASSNVRVAEQASRSGAEVNSCVQDCRENVPVEPALITEAPETLSCIPVL
jgi:hypothetical protein